MTPETPQEIWSSTKWITGVAILREVELGRLELDERISEHLEVAALLALPLAAAASSETHSGRRHGAAASQQEARRLAVRVVTVVPDFGMSMVAAYFPKDHEEKALEGAGGMQGEHSRRY